MLTQTAVTSRNAVKQLIRSMNGTILRSILTLFLSPVPMDAAMADLLAQGLRARGPLGGRLHLSAVRGHEVDNLHRHLVDVVDHVRGLALEQREPEQAAQRRADAERGAVERLGDAVGELGGLVAALVAADRAERLDHACDRAEQTR